MAETGQLISPERKSEGKWTGYQQFLREAVAAESSLPNVTVRANFLRRKLFSLRHRLC